MENIQITEFGLEHGNLENYGYNGNFDLDIQILVYFVFVMVIKIQQKEDK